jgi:hypothetical protein
VQVTSRSYLDLVSKRSISLEKANPYSTAAEENSPFIYLSPHAELPLGRVHAGVCYVIGGKHKKEKYISGVFRNSDSENSRILAIPNSEK